MLEGVKLEIYSFPYNFDNEKAELWQCFKKVEKRSS